MRSSRNYSAMPRSLDPQLTRDGASWGVRVVGTPGAPGNHPLVTYIECADQVVSILSLGSSPPKNPKKCAFYIS